MKLFVTVLEESGDAAIRAIRSLGRDHDGVEVRAERFGEHDLRAIRNATDKSLILTYRGQQVAPDRIGQALDAGFDLVDVEYHPALRIASPPGRLVLSHHDFDGMGALEGTVAAMSSLGCAYTKVAVTPHNFSDNERLLALLELHHPGTALTVIGMGERGLYTRILAPFLGSELVFVSAAAAAAPGQLSLGRALEIYGSQREVPPAVSRVFAVVGNPAGHSRSPAIHNRLFREKGIPAAYTIASIERFDEITGAFLRGQPAGLSVTSPFKEEAYAFAVATGAELAPNARASGAVNTLVNHGGRILADNTDVDGFRFLLRRVAERLDRAAGSPLRVAVAGAGGTARAAIEAARQESIEAACFNRTPGRLGAAPLDDIQSWAGEVVIDTTPVGVELPLRAGMTLIRAAYATHPASEGSERGIDVIAGEELLAAQAVRQNALFCEAAL
jgi:3-dehydroquinate dehydratase / shikimate dehydrogenase